jgi:hypothetical protein
VIYPDSILKRRLLSIGRRCYILSTHGGLIPCNIKDLARGDDESVAGLHDPWRSGEFHVEIITLQPQVYRDIYSRHYPVLCTDFKQLIAQSTQTQKEQHCGLLYSHVRTKSSQEFNLPWQIMGTVFQLRELSSPCNISVELQVPLWLP